MDSLVNIELDLGINAQRFIQQVQLNNKQIEEQVAKGIELALNDICEGDNLVQLVRESTKKELELLVTKSVLSYEVRNKISKVVEEKIGQKIDSFAEKVASKLTSNLE